MKKKFRYIVYVSAAFILIIAALAIFFQTAVFREWIKLKVVALANKKLTASVMVETLEGNLFTRFDLIGLSLKVREESLIEIRRIAVNVNPISLISKTIDLRHVVIDSLKINLIQHDSFTWNYHQIIENKTPAPRSNSSEESPFGWRIFMPDIRVKSSEINIRHLGDDQHRGPNKISQINLNAGFWLDDGQIRSSIGDLNFTSSDPDLVVRTIHSEISYNPEEMSAKNIELETNSSKLSGDVDFTRLNNPRIDLSIEARPLALSEVRRAMPRLQLYGEPSIDVQLRGALNDLQLNGNVGVGQSELIFEARLQLLNKPFKYDVRGSTRHFNMAQLTQTPSLESDLNLNFHLNGQGIEWGQLEANLSVNVDSSLIAGKLISAPQLACQIARDSVSLDLDATVDRAHLQTTASVNFGDEAVRYSFDSKWQNFNLQEFADSIGVFGELNLRLRGNGRGSDPRNMSGAVKVEVESSTVNHIPVDSAYFDLELDSQKLEVNEAVVISPLGQLTTAGVLAADGENNVTFQVQLEDLSKISTFMGQDSIQGHGQLQGRLTGPRQAITIHTSLNLVDLQISDVAVQKLASNGDITYSPTGFVVNLEGNLEQLSGYGIDSLQTNFEITWEDTLSEFKIFTQRGEDSSLELSGSVSTSPDTTTVILSHLQLDFWNHGWEMDKPTVLRISNSKTDISEFAMISEGQRLRLSGQFDPEGGSDLRLGLDNLWISNYDSLLHLKGDLDGRVSLSVAFKGNADRPEVSGSIEMDEGRILDVPFDKFSGNFAVGERMAEWDLVLSKSPNDSLLESSGSVPLGLSLDSTRQWINGSEPLEIKFNARGFDLSLLQPFITGFSNIKGTLIADIVLNNTLHDLRGVGPIRIVDGEFDIRELGTRYRSVSAAMLLKGQDLIIRDFRIKSDGGKLELIEGGLSLSQQSVQQFKTRLRAENFPLMKNKKMQAKVDGELELTGSVQSPYFAGNLAVSESRIYYPAWFEDEKMVELSSKPFFVIGHDSADVDSSGALRFQTSGRRAETAFTESEFYKKLRGELALTFPRNSWIRSSDTNIEISGDLVTVKEAGSAITLFGSLSTLRGHYELLGNRFKVTRGNLVFYGQPDPDPGIDIEAEYEFRDASEQDAEKHIFKVLITGSLSSPEFTFSLDGNQAEQQDVVSILVFGQSYDNLPINQKSNVSNNSGLDDKATGLLTGQLLKRLSGEIGDELSLDMIQIESGKGFEDARLRIGKYVTPDVFVSVSQDFGAEGNRKVELEYEIPIRLRFLNLLLQASQEKRGATGVDVIWKIEW